MAKIEELKSHIATGERLFHTDCVSLRYFIGKVYENLPEKYSLFIWKPYSVRCKKYFLEGEDNQGMCRSWNKKNSRTFTHVNLVEMLEHTIENATQRGAIPDYESTFPSKSVIVLVNPASGLNDPLFTVKLQECSSYLSHINYDLNIIVYTDVPARNTFLQNHSVELITGHPSDTEISDQLNKRADTLSRQRREKTLNLPKNHGKFLFEDDSKYTIKEALKGLQPEQIDSVIDWGILNGGGIQEITDHANEIRARAVQQSELLSFLPPNKQSDPRFIGGFQNFLEYMQECSVCFSEKARELNLDPPKGVVLLGLPGTGKSMAAEALGKVLNKPVLMLDMSSAFGSLVGESESRIRTALKQVEAFGSAILVIDEADKALAGATGHVGDSGTTRRVLGTLLTWLQSHDSETFVVLTMNDPTVVPPEFLRAGRFDKIFYSDLPRDADRKYIIQMQFAKRGIEDFDLTKDQWHWVLEATYEFTGAELEEVVKESQRLAFQTRQDNRPTFQELYEKAQAVIPMARFDKERIEAIRTWCKDRATPVFKTVKK